VPNSATICLNLNYSMGPPVPPVPLSIQDHESGEDEQAHHSTARKVRFLRRCVSGATLRSAPQKHNFRKAYLAKCVTRLRAGRSGHTQASKQLGPASDATSVPGTKLPIWDGDAAEIANGRELSEAEWASYANRWERAWYAIVLPDKKVKSVIGRRLS
jgi:hypothetical protein